MIDFDFRAPTRLIFGKHAEDKLSSLLEEYGFQRVLFVYGGNSIRRNGLYERVVAELKKANVAYAELSGITANPEKRFVVDGVKKAKGMNADFILAVGGGSVIDTAKSIAVSYFYDGDCFDFNLHLVAPKKALPVGVILTIASAGSEMSSSCVITNPETKTKKGFNSDLIRPLFAIENPELTYTVSAYQTAVGAVDTMMHSMERFFSPSEENSLADAWALAVIKNTMIAGKKCVESPTNYEARAQMMLDSSMAHNGLTNLGKPQVMTVHAMEHALSGYRPEIAHGAGIAVCYLGWARYVCKKGAKKFAEFARYLFDIKVEDDEKAAIIGVDAMRDYYLSIGMPTTLRELGIVAEDLPALADLVSANGTREIGCLPQSLNREDVLNVYRLVL